MINQTLQSDPVYGAVYSHLTEIRLKYNGAPLFSPHFPKNWERDCKTFGLPKIMWCGSATNGWYSLDNKTPSEVSKNFLESSVEKYSSQSKFWQAIGNTGSELTNGKADPVQCRRALIIWNNLWKIGAREGEPDAKLKNAQLELSVMALRKEIEISNPDIVIFHIGNLAPSFTDRYFAKNEGIPVSNSGQVELYAGNLKPPHIWMTRKRNMDSQSSVFDALSGIRAAQNK